MRRSRDKHIEKLVGRLAAGKCSVLIGAGSSISCGYPGWGQFLDLLSADLDPSEAARVSAMAVTARADRLERVLAKRTGSSERYREIFRDAFDPKRATAPAPWWVRGLFDLRFDHYLTTNYTVEVEEISRRYYGFEEGLRWHQEGAMNSLRDPKQKRVLYLHGRYDDDPVFKPEGVRVVLGEKSYQSTYFGNAPVARILRTVLGSTTLVVVGASLSDEDINASFRAFAALADSLSEPHYILHGLWPEGHSQYREPEVIEEELLNRYRLQSIFFDVEVDHKKNDRFDGLGRLIEQLVWEVDERRSQQTAPGGQGRSGRRETALAMTLTRLLPSPQNFTSVASDIGFTASQSVLARSPLDRWYGLVGTACWAGKENQLRHAAAERLPERRVQELLIGEPKDLSYADRTRIAEILDGYVQPYFGPTDSSKVGPWSGRDDLGLLALERYWKPASEPKCPEIERWRAHHRSEAEVYKTALSDGLLREDGYFISRDKGLQAAADFLYRRCTEDVKAGVCLIEWALPKLAEIDAFRHEILLHLLAWWAPAEELVIRFLEGRITEETANPVKRLVELTFVERLQREARLGLSFDQVEIPFSIQWAERSGLHLYIAAVLEILGETQAQIYLEWWRKTQGLARVALARALHRCTLEDSPLGEPVLDRAIEATRPETPVKRILQLTKSWQVRKTWFDILPVTPHPPQIAALGEMLAETNGPRARRAAIRSAERLSEHPDLVHVWDVLGERRRQWIDLLEPSTLPQASFARLLASLSGRRLTPEEADDFRRLQVRFKRDWSQTISII